MDRLRVPMKVRERFNSTTPAHELEAPVTPADVVFVVHHLGIPQMEGQPWSLVVDGLVERRMRLDLAQLAALPQVEVRAFHECAGSPLRPTVPVRRVANVEWGGVRLKDVIGLAGIREGAEYVWATGADGGVYPPTGQEVDCYRKDLPLAKALADEVLLATRLNGQPLSEVHGAPARLVVPGFYGTCSVKWLTEIRLEATRAEGYFTTTLYNDVRVVDGVEERTPVWRIAPQAVIVAPAAGARLPRASTQVWGWAWSASPVAKVEVSTDGGGRWQQARLDDRESFGWQRFELPWAPAAGTHLLLARATDTDGDMQPLSGARNAVMQIEVAVG